MQLDNRTEFSEGKRKKAGLLLPRKDTVRHPAVLLAIAALPCVSRQLYGNAQTEAHDAKEHDIRKIPTQDIVRQRICEQRCRSGGADRTLDGDHGRRQTVCSTKRALIWGCRS